MAQVTINVMAVADIDIAGVGEVLGVGAGVVITGVVVVDVGNGITGVAVVLFTMGVGEGIAVGVGVADGVGVGVGVGVAVGAEVGVGVEFIDTIVTDMGIVALAMAPNEAEYPSPYRLSYA